jgi:orotate phosphoribosyltransferase-like protein
MSRSIHAKDIARKLRNREAAANLRADGWRLADIATELGISIGTVHNYLAEAKQEANRRAGDLGEQIRATEDVRLLDIIDRGMAMVDAAAGKCDKHGAPIDFKAASALGTVLRASESRRRLYGVDAPTKLTASFAAQMTEEEALAILAGYDNPIPD